MAVARVSKITAASSKSFDAAVQEGLARASKTIRGITGLHVIEQKASVATSQTRLMSSSMKREAFGFALSKL